MNAFYLISSLIVVSIQLSSQSKKDNLKCIVCQKIVKEIVQAIEKEDPRKTIQVGSFRIEPDGSQRKSEIKYAASEMHLNEIIEKLCDKMEDYAQAKHKETGKIALLKLTEDMDKLSTYDFVPDPELNKGLKSHCENILSDYDEDIISYLRGNTKPILEESIQEVCTGISDICDKIDHEEL